MKKVKLPLYVVPETWAVLYVKPMKGKFVKQGRRCDNCFMWVKPTNRCVIHSPDLEIAGSDVCGYHVAGNPIEDTERAAELFADIEPVDPENSGLENDVPSEGTMCGNCIAYSPSEKDRGHCNAVTTNNDKLPLLKQPVSFYGCCARWEKK